MDLTQEPASGLFAPVGTSWQRVSPHLTTVRRIVGLAAVTLPLAVPFLASLFWPRIWWLTGVLATVLAAVTLTIWVLADRSSRALGYAEGTHELYVTRGALFRRLVVVPYNRIQYVDVTSGPLLRAKDLATVTVHTAAPDTTASVSGVPSGQAQRLRDFLTDAGHASTVGL